MQAEERERWNQARARREELQRIRQEQLDRLEKTKRFAARWREAAELRAYADALQAAGRGPTAASQDQSREEEVAWLRTVANWLDPLIAAVGRQSMTLGPTERRSTRVALARPAR